MLRLLDKWRQRRAHRYWARQAAGLSGVDAAELARLDRQAERLGRKLDLVRRAAARSLVASPAGQVPPQSDWMLRPDLWAIPVSPRGLVPAVSGTAFGHSATVYHDCPKGEVAVVQTANRGGRAPYGVAVDVFEFLGTFVSLSLAFPGIDAASFGEGDLIRADIDLVAEYPVTAFARVNLRHGPNTETIPRSLDMARNPVSVEFDLYYSELEAHPVSDIWLDVLVETPRMNRIDIRDVVISRRPRANI